MQQNRPCLRDELYLLAHRPNGVERVHRPSLSVALAAATLMDLLINDRIQVDTSDRLRVVSLFQMPDPVTNHALEYLADPDARERRELRRAIMSIGNEIYDRTSAGLQMSGRVARRVNTKLIGRNTERYHQSRESAEHVEWLRSMMYHCTQVGHANIDDQSAALCALVAMLRLERVMVDANVPNVTLIAQLCVPVQDMLGARGDGLRWLLAAAEERVGAQATSAY